MLQVMSVILDWTDARYLRKPFDQPFSHLEIACRGFEIGEVESPVYRKVFCQLVMRMNFEQLNHENMERLKSTASNFLEIIPNDEFVCTRLLEKFLEQLDTKLENSSENVSIVNDLSEMKI